MITRRGFLKTLGKCVVLGTVSLKAPFLLASTMSKKAEKSSGIYEWKGQSVTVSSNKDIANGFTKHLAEALEKARPELEAAIYQENTILLRNKE